ncbi:arsenic resistance N-acetyltransferase ArsN2 [Flavihumibacter stibioxidans]|uniref:N-acetyltransferase domain-containing protein n=1 Tax=Flavihumibacter stibioxidans TaxID=1834163 RepID=A0ABR7MDC7_9BACT|nr:arsenic resistance N-acetyltransferase ArsN2 [Flavihumibacter stibioxidans]MBC6492775.1 hypothetical protein [Flavihumibacter stibioxidans]
MPADFKIRPALPEDFLPVCALLESEKLPTADLRKDMAEFFLAVIDGKPVGSIGLDKYGSDALLRSMVVEGSQRSKGIASALVSQLESHSRFLNVSTLYLVTNTAENYFSRKGFVPINRNQLPSTVAASAEFNGLCPVTATIMRKSLTI